MTADGGLPQDRHGADGHDAGGPLGWPGPRGAASGLGWPAVEPTGADRTATAADDDDAAQPARSTT